MVRPPNKTGAVTVRRVRDAPIVEAGPVPGYGPIFNAGAIHHDGAFHLFARGARECHTRNQGPGPRFLGYVSDLLVLTSADGLDYAFQQVLRTRLRVLEGRVASAERTSKPEIGETQMKPHAGDRIVVESEKVAKPGRAGEIEGVLQEDPLRVRVRWEAGHTSILAPTAGAASVTHGKTRA